MSYEQTAAEQTSAQLDAFIEATKKGDLTTAQNSFRDYVKASESSARVTNDSLTEF